MLTAPFKMFYAHGAFYCFSVNYSVLHHSYPHFKYRTEASGLHRKSWSVRSYERKLYFAVTMEVLITPLLQALNFLLRIASVESLTYIDIICLKNIYSVTFLKH